MQLGTACGACSDTQTLSSVAMQELVRIEYAKRLRIVQQLLLRGADVQTFRPFRTEASPRRVFWSPGYVVAVGTCNLTCILKEQCSVHTMLK